MLDYERGGGGSEKRPRIRAFRVPYLDASACCGRSYAWRYCTSDEPKHRHAIFRERNRDCAPILGTRGTVKGCCVCLEGDRWYSLRRSVSRVSRAHRLREAGPVLVCGAITAQAMTSTQRESP